MVTINKVQQYIKLRTELINELQEIDDRANELLALISRKEEIELALFGEVSAENPPEEKESKASDDDMLLVYLALHPGASRKDIRDAFTKLTDREVLNLIARNSKHKRIVNKGVSKAKPAWYLVKSKK